MMSSSAVSEFLNSQFQEIPKKDSRKKIPTIIMNYGSTQETQSASLNTPTSGDPKTLAKLRTWGLISGLGYVIIIVCGIVAEVGIRDKLIDFDSPEDTVENIINKPMALRWSMMLEMTMASADIVVSILFAFILVSAGANPILSLASSAFRFMQQAIITGNLMNLFAASILVDPNFDQHIPIATIIGAISGANEDADNSTNAAESLAFFFLTLHKYGYLLALLFFGLSLVTLGMVIVGYGVFPKCLGWTLLLAGICYLLDSLLYFLLDSYQGQASNYLMIPVFIAEFALTGWLLFKAPQLSPIGQQP
eukprot:Nitzschia sp. Nitz4//scaffold46_size129759//125322//126406//NITZ4_003528-RA/size129759-augustus-gene-0.15-mRNA-1//1//CDS//3329552676//809//frame0